MADADTPTLGTITRVPGIAGQYGYRVAVTYPGEPVETVTFVGSTYGGPIVMETAMGQTFVSSAVLDRIGRKLTPEWVRAFFA
jgi:hypothetical protein